MGYRKIAARYLSKWTFRLYSGPIQSAVTALGVDDFLKSGYQRVFSSVAGESVTLDSSGYTIEIEASVSSGPVRALEREKPILEAFLDEVNSGDVVFDAGAHIGWWSCFAGVAGADVVAFEPLPANARVLRSNLERNGVSGEVYEVALSNENGRTTLAVDSPTAGTSTAILASVSDGIDVELRQGDEFGQQHQPDLIKIDVEGAEREVIEGLSSTLDESVRAAFIEVHDAVSVNDVRHDLKELGFVDFVVFEHPENNDRHLLAT